MTLFWSIIGLALLIIVAVTFYKFGLEDGHKRGYAKGRNEVNAHLDAYRKNGGWSV